jgi:hypothetical protein
MGSSLDQKKMVRGILKSIAAAMFIGVLIGSINAVFEIFFTLYIKK